MTVSISLCWHKGIPFCWGLHWWRQWVSSFGGTLHQGLSVRHQLVLSQEVKGQSTWGWCHWWQHPWHTGRQHHRCSSRWSLCLSWAVHAEEQSRWTGSGWRDWGMLPCLRTPGVLWHLLVLVGRVWHWPYLGLGAHHQHHKDSQRNWQLGPYMCFCGLNTYPYLWVTQMRFCRWAMCSTLIWPWTVMSPVIPMHPWHSSRMWSIFFWKMSWEQTRPKGTCRKWYLLKGLLKVVSRLDS